VLRKQPVVVDVRTPALAGWHIDPGLDLRNLFPQVIPWLPANSESLPVWQLRERKCPPAQGSQGSTPRLVSMLEPG
jgi:rhodanese-related sulfurtransferase